MAVLNALGRTRRTRCVDDVDAVARFDIDPHRRLVGARDHLIRRAPPIAGARYNDLLPSQVAQGSKHGLDDRQRILVDEQELAPGIIDEPSQRVSGDESVQGHDYGPRADNTPEQLEGEQRVVHEQAYLVAPAYAGSDQGIGHLAGALLKLSPSQGFGAADHGDAVGGEPGMVRDDVWIEVIVREFQRHGTASSRL